MKIAYIILSHKNPAQLVRLISKLQNGNTSFFIHIDKKTDNRIYGQIVSRFDSTSNVYFLKRYKCFWGNFNIVKATIEGIKRVVKTGIRFDYTMLISGQDYLIKSTKQIEEFLQRNEGKEFIDFFSLNSSNKWNGQDYDGLNRTRYWHFRFRNKHFYLPIKRQFSRGFHQAYGGSQWWCLSRECIEYINDFISQNHEFVNYFKHTSIPDETFFQTIVLKSE